MAKHKPAPVSPKAIKQAEDLWGNFTKLSTYGVVATIIILVLLALFFVQW